MSQKLNEKPIFEEDLLGPKDLEPATAQSANDPLTIVGNRTLWLRDVLAKLQALVATFFDRYLSLEKRVYAVEHGNVEFTRVDAPVPLLNGQSTLDTKGGAPVPIWSPEGGRVSTRALVESGGGALTTPTAASEYRISIDAESIKTFKSTRLTLIVMGSLTNPAVAPDTNAAKAYGNNQSAALLAAYNAAVAAQAAAQAVYDAALLSYKNVDVRKDDYTRQRAHYYNIVVPLLATIGNPSLYPGDADWTLYQARHTELANWGDAKPGAPRPSWVNFTDRSGTGVSQGIVINGITEHFPGKSGPWYTAVRTYLLNDAGYHFNERAERDLSGTSPSTAALDAAKADVAAKYAAWQAAYNAAYNTYITNNPGSPASPGGSIALNPPNSPAFTLYEVNGVGDSSALATANPPTTTNKVYTIDLTPDRRISPNSSYYLAVRPAFYNGKMLRTDVTGIVASYVE